MATCEDIISADCKWNCIVPPGENAIYVRLAIVADYKTPIRSSRNPSSLEQQGSECTSNSHQIKLVKLVEIILSKDELFEIACKALCEAEKAAGVSCSDCISMSIVKGYPDVDLDYLLDQEDRERLSAHYREVSVRGFTGIIPPNGFYRNHVIVEVFGRKGIPTKRTLIEMAEQFGIPSVETGISMKNDSYGRYTGWISWKK